MLIVNDAHLCLAGRSSLEERCHYCKKPLAAYPLVMSDDAKQTVYHVTCALELATDLLVDLATFFHPPIPYDPDSLNICGASYSPQARCAKTLRVVGPATDARKARK